MRRIAVLAALFALNHEKEPLKHYFAPVALILTVVVLCTVLRHHFRKCIHYMRVREVVYVLESAHLASSKEGFTIEDLIHKPDPGDCAKCPLIERPGDQADHGE